MSPEQLNNNGSQPVGPAPDPNIPGQADSVQNPLANSATGAVSAMPGQAPAGQPDAMQQPVATNPIVNPAVQPNVMANTTDPTQPGYVPPANFGQPQPTNFNGQSFNNGMSGGSKKKVFMLAGAVIGVIVLAGALVMAMGLLSSGAIKTSDLVEETHGKLTIKRPASWQKISEVSYDVVFINGSELKESTAVLVAESQTIGLNFADLGQSEKEALIGAVKEGLSGDTTANCEGNADITVKEISKPGFDGAFEANGTCTKKKDNRETKYRLRVVIGFHQRDMHLVMVVTEDSIWSKSTDAINEMFEAFRPASQ